MKSKFYLLMKRDMLLFWNMFKVRFFCSILLILLVISIVTYQISNILPILNISKSNVHFLDIYLYLFWGIEYKLVKTNHFNFPIVWLVLEILPFYILGDAFKINITKYSILLTGRLVSKNNIFAIKSLLLSFLFTIYQLIIIIFTYISSILFFNPNLSMGNFLSSITNTGTISNNKIFTFILIQTFSLICLLYLFNCLTLCINTIYAVIIIFLLIFSAIYIPFYKIFWMNSTMFSRILELNISETYIISTEILLSFLLYFIGNILYKNKQY